MKIKDNYLLSDIEGENIVITIGNVENTFNGYLKINDTSKFLWNLLETDISLEELNLRFEKKFSIDAKLAEEDVKEFLKTIREINALEE